MHSVAWVFGLGAHKSFTYNYSKLHTKYLTVFISSN